jgi:hypothetical protein
MQTILGVKLSQALAPKFGTDILRTIAKTLRRELGNLTMVAYTAYKPIGLIEGTTVRRSGPSPSQGYGSGSSTSEGSGSGSGLSFLEIDGRSVLSIVSRDNVTVEYSVSVLRGVTDSMIADLNKANQDGNFTAVLSNYTGTPLIVMGTFTKVEMEVKAAIITAGNWLPLHRYLCTIIVRIRIHLYVIAELFYFNYVTFNSADINYASFTSSSLPSRRGVLITWASRPVRRSAVSRLLSVLHSAAQERERHQVRVRVEPAQFWFFRCWGPRRHRVNRR